MFCVVSFIHSFLLFCFYDLPTFFSPPPPQHTAVLREVGKNRKSAVDEVVRTAELLDYAAEEGVRVAGQVLSSDSWVGQKRNKFAVVERVPLGVVLCIPPFNYPVNLCGSKIGPALIAGNAVVIKTPTQGAVSTLHLGAALKMAGCPPGKKKILFPPPPPLTSSLLTWTHLTTTTPIQASSML